MALNLSLPAEAPPPGITPDFDHPQNQNALALFIFTFCTVVSTLCFGLRAYTEVYLQKKFGAEEVLVLCSFGLFTGAIACMYLFEADPGFVHQYEMTLGDVIEPTRLVFVFGVLYTLVLCMLKLAVLIEWTRILVPRGTWRTSAFWWGCLSVGLFQVLSVFAILVAINLQCIPHSAIWDFTIPNAKCFSLYHLELGSCSIQLFSDICMFLLPQKVIWGLRLNTQKKIGVAFVFGIGLFTCIASTFRLVATVQYGTSTSDAFWKVGPMAYWCTAEMTCVFIVLAGTPMPRFLESFACFRRMRRGMGFGTNGGTSGPSGTRSRKMGASVAISSRPGGTVNKDYYTQMDDDSLAMGDLKPTESTEHLKTSDGGSGITRTTRVHITQDYQARDGNRGEPMGVDTWEK